MPGLLNIKQKLNSTTHFPITKDQPRYFKQKAIWQLLKLAESTINASKGERC